MEGLPLPQTFHHSRFVGSRLEASVVQRVCVEQKMACHCWCGDGFVCSTGAVSCIACILLYDPLVCSEDNREPALTRACLSCCTHLSQSVLLCSDIVCAVTVLCP